jgi:SRSO17 transposase
MQLFKTDYCPELLGRWKDEVNEARVDELLQSYVRKFDGVIANTTQRTHFQTYLKGLMSNLDRKSIEPMALELGGEGLVRPLQQFITRSTLKDDEVSFVYRKTLAQTVNSENGMFSIDDTGHVKKGKNSVGVKRQYCGRLGKVENCQVVVNIAKRCVLFCKHTQN